MNKIFVDSDTILDLFTKRVPFYKYSAELFTIVDSGKVAAYVSPLIFANLFYVLRKIQSKNFAIENLQKLKLLVKILPVDDKIISLALISDFKDFEDAIQYYTSKANNINFIITRNKSDYKVDDIIIFTAEEYLDILRSGSNKIKKTLED